MLTSSFFALTHIDDTITTRSRILIADSHAKILDPSQALAYLFHQSPHVFPIVGVQTVQHIHLLPGALSISLSKQDIEAIHAAKPFDPLFPNSFLWEGRAYSTRLTGAEQTNYRMACWLGEPGRGA